MQIIQLYIEGERVDMFKDESVTITDTLKNVKELDKIFTEFSRTFSLPASKANNKLFKHFYNDDIQTETLSLYLWSFNTTYIQQVPQSKYLKM